MVEQVAVNDKVPGSSPGPGASTESIEDQGVPLVFVGSSPKYI